MPRGAPRKGVWTVNVSEAERAFVERAIRTGGGEVNRFIRDAVIRHAEQVLGERFGGVADDRRAKPQRDELSRLLLTDPEAFEERLVAAVTRRIRGGGG